MSRHGNNAAARSGYTIVKYGAAACALVCLTAWQSPVWAQSARETSNTPLSSDGRGLESKFTGTAISLSNRGTGRSLAAGEVDDREADIRARGETASEFERILSAQPRTAPAGTESIIGADQRTRVNPTTTYPARATVLITFNTPSGASRCTGFMISRDTVATAGHCVASGTNGKFYNPASYRVYPGRNGGTSPYGSCTAVRLHSVVGWVKDGKEDFDYGAVKLRCNIGNTTGWYGMWAPSSSQLEDNPAITTQGYPGDKPLQQWMSRDSIRVIRERQVFYKADTVGGQSGSPVWRRHGDACTACALAIHAYGLHGSFPHGTHNHGTRFTNLVLSNLRHWKDAAK